MLGLLCNSKSIDNRKVREDSCRASRGVFYINTIRTMGIRRAHRFIDSAVAYRLGGTALPLKTSLVSGKATADGKMQVSQYEDGFLPQPFNQAKRGTAERGRLRIVIALVLRGRYSGNVSATLSCLSVFYQYWGPRCFAPQELVRKNSSRIIFAPLQGFASFFMYFHHRLCRRSAKSLTLAGQTGAMDRNCKRGSRGEYV